MLTIYQDNTEIFNMQTETKLPFITLLFMISFASVNAVLFTPALPDIVSFFKITDATAQQTITWFLIGYAFGQLIYGPIANRFGRKPALYIGVSLQIISSLLCVFSGYIHEYTILVIGRFLLALGSGVGLKMTFTLVNECYEPKIASQKISYLMLAFAITPGLGVAIGGILNMHYGWMSCFYASAIYGFILLLMLTRLPETQKILNYNALKLSHLLHGYSAQFKNKQLIAGGLIMGGSTCFVYIFAALAPFIAINLFGMSSAEYGIANLLPPIGLILGSLISPRLVNRYSLELLIRTGILIAGTGVILMIVFMLMHMSVIISLFSPIIIIYFGLSFILANASSIAMSHTSDKAHGSAVMNFINMGIATIAVLSLGFFNTTQFILPIIYVIICIGMLLIYKCLLSTTRSFN